MYSTSKKRFEKAKLVIPSGVTSPVRYFEPYPFFVKKADGCHMWDTRSRKLVDMCNGYGALLLGHRRREIMRAVAKQMKRGTIYCAPTAQETELACMISENFPSIDTVRFVNTGGEATMTAIRLARGYTKRDKILKFQGCYHGAHDAVLVEAGSGAAHYGIPTSDGIPEQSTTNTLVSEYNDYGGVEQLVRDNPDSIACAIIEPVMANMGLILPQDDFLQRLRKITRQHGILLIFDEVVTGFRVSSGGAQSHYNVRPDITTLGKALGNGFGIAAVGGDRKVMDLLAPGGPVYQASTFAGNPVATSAAIASMKVMGRLKEKMYTRLERLCTGLARIVGDIATDYGIPHRINSIASMMQIFFTDAGEVRDHRGALKADAARFQIMFKKLLEEGVFIAPSQFEVAFLSNAHEDHDIDMVAAAYDKGIKAVRDAR